jgi:hypothetical protein
MPKPGPRTKVLCLRPLWLPHDPPILAHSPTNNPPGDLSPLADPTAGAGERDRQPHAPNARRETPGLRGAGVSDPNADRTQTEGASCVSIMYGSREGRSMRDTWFGTQQVGGKLLCGSWPGRTPIQDCGRARVAAVRLRGIGVRLTSDLDVVEIPS